MCVLKGTGVEVERPVWRLFQDRNDSSLTGVRTLMTAVDRFWMCFGERGDRTC